MRKLLFALTVLVAVLVVIVVMLFRNGATVFDSLADDFYKWPVEKQVAEATVIARATWRVEGDEYKCIIAEIIKKAPNAVFDYVPGHEFRRGNRRAKPNVTYGDGQMLFFTGIPPTLRFITAISDGRLLGVSDIKLGTLRAAIQNEQK